MKRRADTGIRPYKKINLIRSAFVFFGRHEIFNHETTLAANKGGERIKKNGIAGEGPMMISGTWRPNSMAPFTRKSKIETRPRRLSRPGPGGSLELIGKQFLADFLRFFNQLIGFVIVNIYLPRF
jgi:hypothetical protein